MNRKVTDPTFDLRQDALALRRRLYTELVSSQMRMDVTTYLRTTWWMAMIMLDYLLRLRYENLQSSIRVTV